MKDRAVRLGLSLAAALLALVFAAAVTAIVLRASGHNPSFTIRAMFSYGFQPGSIVSILDSATTYYLSAVAVAIGFRMNLFNIGVDGQYQLAALFAAWVGGNVALPGPLRLVAIVVTAVAVGAIWSGIAGVLKATRGVSEVISTIMLNFVATGIIAFLLTPGRFAIKSESNNVATRTIPDSAHVPGLHLIPGQTPVFGFIVVAALAGVGMHVLVNKTRFGFDLRATGMSASAATSSGVSVPRMVVVAMLVSGGLAGLVSLPDMLGNSYNYSLNTPSGLGFTGIAIALLGRNNPIGIAFAALLWAFLDQSSQILQLNDVPKEIVQITQGIAVLAVVVAYEVIRRLALRQQQRAVGRQLSRDDPDQAAVPA